ncbi:hypothetical protein AU375_06566 [Methylobacterium radiotolerans]|nr:hypothetical protein AU375_06566 [Methylobacterium radiotolerans]
MDSPRRDLSACGQLRALDPRARTHFRLVDVSDAAFIFDLRQDAAIGRYLNKPAPSVAEQAQWIEAYKSRERRGEDFYFVIMHEGRRRGLVRLYDIRSLEGRESFSWGSWIIPPPPVPGLASYSALAIYEIGFAGFGFDQSHFDVRKGNTKVLGFHTSTGARIVSEDAENFYFVFERDRYDRLLADKADAARHHGAIL